MLTANNSGAIAGFSADDNGYDGMTLINGKFSGKQFVLNVNSSNWSGKITWERKEGKLIKTVTTDKSTVQVIFTKKQ
ncbi:MAG: hypothetical protein NTV87_13640 [Ignavibacteriae bacterium]|nr:hypothetical protein [Ignavibacteriota bacterium]